MTKNKILIFEYKLVICMNNENRSMPICFTPDQIKALEEYAKKKGMLNCNQAIEEIIESL